MYARTPDNSANYLVHNPDIIGRSVGPMGGFIPTKWAKMGGKGGTNIRTNQDRRAGFLTLRK